MDPRREDRLERLFEAASALASPERDAFLSAECRDDPGLRDEIAGLLERSTEARAYVGRIAVPAVDRGLSTLFYIERGEDPRIGTTVAHFRVVATLGSGGMGRVYQARDETLGRTVALKLLPADAWADDAVRRRFEREARAASAIDHPNVAAIHEFGRTAEGQPFIAMTFCPGESLRDILARGPLPSATALAYAVQVAEALRHAHDAGVVHRDVKPANVMVAPDGHVRLVDFGIALMSGDATREGISLGTVAYMSPEQTLGASVDARTDIWGVGTVLHEMLTGRKAFARDGDTATVHAIRHDAPGTAGDPPVPWPIAAIVARCLEKEPGRRYQRAEALLADLQAAARGERPTAARRWGRLRLTMLPLLALGALQAGAAPGAPQPHEVRPAAMALFVQAVRARSPREFVHLLEQAASADPQFALAHAALGVQYTLSVHDSARARREVATALAIDPTLPKAWLALGLERSWMAHDWDAAERAFRRAIALDPRYVEAHHELGQLLMRRRRCDDAVAEEQRAILYQPTEGQVQSGLAEILYYCRRYDDAAREFERTLALSRDSAGALLRLGAVYFQQGRREDALDAYRRSREPVPPWVDVAFGDRAVAVAKVAAAEAQWARGDADYFTGWYLAQSYASLGDRDAALTWLERVARTGNGPIVYLGVDPLFDPLRGEPRFRALMRRLGLDR